MQVRITHTGADSKSPILTKTNSHIQGQLTCTCCTELNRKPLSQWNTISEAFPPAPTSVWDPCLPIVIASHVGWHQTLQTYSEIVHELFHLIKLYVNPQGRYYHLCFTNECTGVKTLSFQGSYTWWVAEVELNPISAGLHGAWILFPIKGVHQKHKIEIWRLDIRKIASANIHNTKKKKIHLTSSMLLYSTNHKKYGRKVNYQIYSQSTDSTQEQVLFPWEVVLIGNIPSPSSHPKPIHVLLPWPFYDHYNPHQCSPDQELSNLVLQIPGPPLEILTQYVRLGSKNLHFKQVPR